MSSSQAALFLPNRAYLGHVQGFQWKISNMDHGLLKSEDYCCPRNEKLHLFLSIGNIHRTSSGLFIVTEVFGETPYESRASKGCDTYGGLSKFETSTP
jgi:hypothetical protein